MKCQAEAQAGIKTARRNINNLRYADDTTLMVEREEKLKSLLMKVKEESQNVGLKLTKNCGKFLERDGNIRPPYLSPEKPVYSPRSNS